jgi:hypothetical protein
LVRNIDARAKMFDSDCNFTSEARMRAPGHRWSTLILIVTIALTIGCRGSRPFNPLVRVSQKPDSDLPEIEPPQQRLATAKTRNESTPLGTRRADGSPHVTSTGLKESSVAGKTEKDSAAGITEFSLDDRSLQRIATKPPTSKATAQTAAKTSATSSVLSEVDLDSVEPMDAFRDSPPDVQRAALRLAAATLSQQAGKTSQPNSLESELAKNALQQHELADEKKAASEVPPKRIATEPQSEQSSATSTSQASESATSDEKSSAKAGGVDDAAATKSESAVRTISDSVENDPSSVQPASASRSRSDQTNVAQAAGESIEKNSIRSHMEAETKQLSDQKLYGALLKRLETPATGESEKNSIRAQIEAEIDAETKQLSDQTLYGALLKRLATPAAGESEADRSGRLFKLRHLMVLSGDPDAAVEQIEGMSEPEQEYLRHQLLGLWMMIDPQGHPVPSRRFTTALPQIREATKFAAAATDSLDIRSLAFCTEIESYGQIKTFPGNRFDAGQQVILYCEIENFTVKKTDQGFETNLQGSYELYNSENEKVISQVLPADNQVSANYLRDYFIAYQMHLPKQLKPGTYRLQLTMEDIGGKKYGQSSIPLEIVR